MVRKKYTFKNSLNVIIDYVPWIIIQILIATLIGHTYQIHMNEKLICIYFAMVFVFLMISNVLSVDVMKNNTLIFAHMPCITFTTIIIAKYYPSASYIMFALIIVFAILTYILNEDKILISKRFFVLYIRRICVWGAMVVIITSLALSLNKIKVKRIEHNESSDLKWEKVIPIFSDEIFYKLNYESKVDLLLKTANLAGKDLGIFASINVCIVQIDNSNVYGFHNSSINNTIFINEWLLVEGTPEQILSTVLHEVKHIEQKIVTTFFEAGYKSEEVLKLKRFEEESSWIENKNSYINPHDSYEEYLEQPLERDSRKYELRSKELLRIYGNQM